MPDLHEINILARVYAHRWGMRTKSFDMEVKAQEPADPDEKISYFVCIFTG
jgi:hypothetical protein